MKMILFLKISIIILSILVVYSIFVLGKGICLGYEYSLGYQFGSGFSHLNKNINPSLEGCSAGYYLLPADFIFLSVLSLLLIFKKRK